MAALNFPSSPSVNQVYSSGGKSWTWNGTSWLANSIGAQGPSGAQGTNGSNGSQGIQGITGSQGTTGTNGSQGATGSGAQGVQGIQGLQGGTSAGGSNTFIQYNNNGSLGGSANHTFDITSNTTFAYSVNVRSELRLQQWDTPVAPSTGNLTLFARSVGGRMVPAFIGPSGLDSSLQPHIARNRVAWIQWVGTAALANTQVGFNVAPTYVGTVTNRVPAPTSLYQSIRRMGLVSAATAGANVNMRVASAHWLRGNVASMGGFHWISRFGVADAASVAGAGMFIGFTNTTTLFANSANVVTLANTIAVGQIPTSNNLCIITNNSQAAAYVIDTGLQCNVGNAAIWDVAMFAAPNDSKVQIGIINVANTAQTYSATITANATNLPLGNTMLCPHMWRSNGGAASAVAIDLISLYIETDT